MKRVWRGSMVLGVCLTLTTAGSAALPHVAQADARNYNGLTAMQKRLASGAFATALGSPRGLAAPNIVTGGGDDDNGGVEGFTVPPAQLAPAGQPSNYQPASTATGGCEVNRGSNVKVNQDCATVTDADLQGRGQSQNETSIAADPNQPNHLVASYNDYRRGDGGCYGAYSRDGGRTWSDTTIPIGFTRGQPTFGAPRQYWQAGGDTSVAFDTKGNAYFSCQVFDRGSDVSPDPDQSSAFYVFRSTGNGGASWNFPGRPVMEHNDTVGAGTVLEDKQLLTVDDHRGSPYQDRVYVSWTEFAADGSAYIYATHSADYGESFSAPVLVSTTSSLCDLNDFGVTTTPSNCNENQFSQPFTAADGTLYIAWANFNNQNPAPSSTSPDNRYQMLLARSTDGGATFSAPVKVGDYYDLPDCATYQAGADAGRACVPEKNDTANSIFRATNYAVGAVDPRDSRHVVVTYGSYVNRTSNEHNGCVPAGFSPFGNPDYTGVKTAGACNNGIVVSESRNGGATFTGTAADPRIMPTVTDGSRQRTTDQFWQWADFSDNGRLAVSYYDRQYGTDEATGYSDVSVSLVGGHDVSVVRATSSSMPPPTGFSGLFYGDYSGMTVTGRTVLPLWSDTRDAELFLCPGTGVTGVPPRVCTGSATNAAMANDQDAFTTRIGVEGGPGR